MEGSHKGVERSMLEKLERLHVNTEDFKKLTETYSENFSLFLFSLSAFCFGVNNFLLKYIQNYENYDFSSMTFWRFVFFTFIILMFMKFNKKEILDVKKIKNKFWFCTRTLCPYASLILFMASLYYLRVGTVTCMCSINPVVVVILSTTILKEKFHIRYLIGIVICFIGVLIILSNEGNNSKLNQKVYENYSALDVFIGVFLCIINLIIIGLITVSCKILSKENIDQENQCFYLGLFSLLFSIVSVMISGKLYFSISFLFYCSMSALIFLMANYLITLSVKGVDLNKTVPLNYLSVVVCTYLSISILGDSLYFTDVFGSLIIIMFNSYNSYYPVEFKS